MKQIPKLKAKVIFTHPEQGGRVHRLRSGSRSQFKVDEESTSCVVVGGSEDQVFDYGVEYDVTLELLFWEHYQDRVYVGMPVQLSEGNRVVGKGVVAAIVRA